MKKRKTNNAFRKAIIATPEICCAYCNGLQALRRADAVKIKPGDKYKVDGSVDIDSAVKVLYPEANRWDYAIGYDAKVCFVEVHPAYTKEIDTMVKKFHWLKEWLKEMAPQLESIPKMTPAYVWIQSGKSAILPTAKQSKILASIGLPRPGLQLR